MEISVSADGQIILLAVVGMSPSILTETLWALAHEPIPVLPHRIIVVTTTAGRQKIEKQLFQPIPRFGNRCAWDMLRDALAKDAFNIEGRLRFGITPDDIRVITTLDASTGRSHELADIRNPGDNEAAADFMLDQVRSITENPDTHLIASIAGGRKTMGALLYACMTLAGRETDRLTHVLVNEPFETMPEFYFPAQTGGALTAREDRQLDPKEAIIELADVTFVPLRNLFWRELKRPAGNFSALVHSCRENIRQQAAEGIKLSVDRARTEMLINDQSIKLQPREQMVLLFLAERAKRVERPYSCYEDAVGDLDQYRLQLKESAPKNRLDDWRHGDTFNNKFEDEQELRRIVSSIRGKVKFLGHSGAVFAASLPGRGRFSLDVPGPMIYLK